MNLNKTGKIKWKSINNNNKTQKQKLQQVFSDEIKAHNSFFYDVIEQQQTDFWCCFL